MNRKKSIYLIITIVLISTVVFGQEKSAKSLYFLKGEWQVENYIKEQDTWKHLGNTQSIINLEHNGKFVSERTKFLTRFGEINMITFIGFDSKAKEFKLTAMDKEYGLMDVYLGNWVDGNLIFDNLKSDLPIQLQDGSNMHFRVSYKEIIKNSFTHLVEGSTDRGKTWSVFSKASFRKSPVAKKPMQEEELFSISDKDKKEIEALKKSIPLVLANVGWEPYTSLFSKNYKNWSMTTDKVLPREEYLAIVKDWYDAGNRATDSDVTPIDFIPISKNKVLFLHKQIEKFDLTNETQKTARDIRFIAIVVKEGGKWKLEFTAFMDVPNPK